MKELLRAPVVGAGRGVLDLADEVGAVSLLMLRAAAATLTLRADRAELWRALHRVGVASLPLVIATAFLTGVIVVLQTAVFVERYGATLLVGWGTGFVSFREIGPVLIAVMFSGRVGSRNAAELATMTVTEQIDALRSLAVDPHAYLVAPRLIAMTAANFLLTVIGDCFAVVGGAVAGRSLLDVSLGSFWDSFVSYVYLEDLTHGLLKSAVFGLAVGVVSCHAGLSAEGGARGVGRAVNRAVVGGALAVFVLDYLITSGTAR